MLTFQNLTVRRGGQTVLDGVTGTVPAGRALIVTGPNGAGKSTLLRTLAGFLPPSGGSATLASGQGADPVRLADRGAWQERVAYAGHLDAVKPALGVAQNLLPWAALAGWEPDAAAEAVDAALARFGLQAMAARPAGECSAGQRRRLGLARLSLARRPVWLMDEPTASLDTASAATVAALVAEHLKGGGIAVIATHLELGLADPVRLPLDQTRAARLAPPAAGAAAEPADDPFLAGDW
ncbi:MAG: heme ABC exporter ATP-binding protein CcmA [Pseudomonadota bacterium]